MVFAEPFFNVLWKVGFVNVLHNVLAIAKKWATHFEQQVTGG